MGMKKNEGGGRRESTPARRLACAQRASFLAADGGFNADAFRSSLVRSRVASAAAVSGVWVVWPLILCGVAIHYLLQILEMKAEVEAHLQSNLQTHPWTALVPVIVGAPFLHKAATFVPAMEREDGAPRTLNYQERATLARYATTSTYPSWTPAEPPMSR